MAVRLILENGGLFFYCFFFFFVKSGAWFKWPFQGLGAAEEARESPAGLGLLF